MTQPQARILVVDDERNIRRTLGMVLKTAGYQAERLHRGTRLPENRHVA